MKLDRATVLQGVEYALDCLLIYSAVSPVLRIHLRFQTSSFQNREIINFRYFKTPAVRYSMATLGI